MKKFVGIAIGILLIGVIGWSAYWLVVRGPAPSPTSIAQVEPLVTDQRPTPRVETTGADLLSAGHQAEPPRPAGSIAADAVTPSPLATTQEPADPFAQISLDSLFAFLTDLTSIQPYSGWRNSATEGESEALDYVKKTLEQLPYLQTLGMELERQEFHVFMATELWDTRLDLAVDGRVVEVPADGLRGPRDEVEQALRFDSDGTLNDASPDPLVVEGPIVPIRSAEAIHALGDDELQGKLVFLDYAVIDRVLIGNATEVAWELLSKEPAGLVLVTTFSNEPGESHGTFVSDVSALNWVATETTPPILYVRLEDLSAAGIADWDDLDRITTARLTLDADVFSPGTSGNMIARIPGADPSQAMILGAHIDSPNSPGAMDDGSGSAILLEVARVLDASFTQPPTDLYLVWFGSEELGLYGSGHFAATHQDLLDRTQAMLQTDMLSRPLDGIDADLTLVTWSYGRLGDDRLLWPESLIEASAAHGVESVAEDLYYMYSDNSSFGGFDVPHADLIYMDEEAMEATGSIHHAAHIHDPYDTVELAREVGDVLEQMAHVVLTAALDVAPDATAHRVAPPADRRALLVASHNESIHMTPAGLTEFGMALAMEGFDVDLIPFGQAVTAQDTQDADLVIVLPVVDYPSPGGDVTLYDEAWTAEEITALESYVAGGGLLVLTNSGHRLKHGNSFLDPNEDWHDMNALAERFGIGFRAGSLPTAEARAEGDHPLVDGIQTLTLIEGNGVPFDLAADHATQVLAWAGQDAAVALIGYGAAGGEVLVLSDVAILGADWYGPDNLPFWQNLARYAR